MAGNLMLQADNCYGFTDTRAARWPIHAPRRRSKSGTVGRSRRKLPDRAARSPRRASVRPSSTPAAAALPPNRAPGAAPQSRPTLSIPLAPASATIVVHGKQVALRGGLTLTAEIV